MVDKYDQYRKNLKEEGVDYGDAVLAVMNKVEADHQGCGTWSISGTKAEFEIFTDGFAPEKKERVRQLWGFTDG